MKMMTKSHSYDQNQLKHLCDRLCDNIEDVLDSMQLEYRKSNKMIIMQCPIHGGDNESALNLYHEGDSYRGNWVCRTHNCEKTFKKSILGFIRGFLSKNKYDWSEHGDQTVSFYEAVKFAESLIGENLSDYKISDVATDKIKFSTIINAIKNKTTENSCKIDRQLICKSLKIPAQYFVDRGYDPEILKKYDVGLCINPSKEMYNRAVAPIYDQNHEYMIGCTGRSIFEKCDKCSKFHETDECPIDNNWKYAKWKHSSGFKADSILYNMWFAKDYIKESATAIIVESPGNVWKLEEAGFHNSVAIFGSSLSDKQKILLDGSGAMNLILLTDNDEAGRKAKIQIREKCEKTYKIYEPIFNENDISCLDLSTIQSLINSTLEKIL